MKMTRGQLTLFGIIYMFIALVVFRVFLPLQMDMITNVTTDPNTDSMTKTILPLVIPLEAIGILMIPIVYSRVQRYQEGQGM
jgi:hypothetical protein